MSQTGVLTQVSPTRAAAVRAIPLSEALSTLRRLALNAEIRYSNHVLRVLHELDGGIPVTEPHRMPTFLRMVEPIGHHGYRKHVAETGTTFCGLDCSSWRDTGRISPDAVVGSDSICQRCRRSVQLELGEA